MNVFDDQNDVPVKYVVNDQHEVVFKFLFQYVIDQNYAGPFHILMWVFEFWLVANCSLGTSGYTGRRTLDGDGWVRPTYNERFWLGVVIVVVVASSFSSKSWSVVSMDDWFIWRKS
jgi:hypothetical protein